MSTASTLIHEWSDQPQPGRSVDDWPYPTRYSKSLITGDLADAIRARLGQPPHAAVVITETVVSGGYSEYTQENYYDHTITCGDETVQLGSSWRGSGIHALTDWLDNLAIEESAS